MLSIRWTGQQELHHHAGWPISSPISLYAHIQEGHALVEGSELGFSRQHPRRRLARLLVLLPRRLLALGGAVERVPAPCTRFCAEGAADVALASRLEDSLNFDQLSLVVLHVLDELADGVVGAVDLVVLGGEGFEEKGGEGGGGDVGGGEPEDVSDLSARIELGLLSKLKRRKISLCLSEGLWVSMDHSKSKKHEGFAVYLALASNTSKKIRIEVFEHFTHQLVIVLIDPLVTVCIRS